MKPLIAALLSLALVACSPGSGNGDRRAPEQPAQPEQLGADDSKSPTATKTPAATTADPPTTLEPYPGAKQFCDGRVYPAGGGGHISWDSYATSESRSVVVHHYKKLLGEANLEELPEGATWRFPKNRPTRVLSVESTNVEAPWKNDCGVPDSAQTILTISHFPR